MKKDKLTPEEGNLPVNDGTENKSNTKTYFYIAVACCALSAVAFGLSFTVLGIYSLISSVLLEFAALSFTATQKKKNNFPAVKIVTVAAYALLGLSVLLFIGGLIYSTL